MAFTISFSRLVKNSNKMIYAQFRCWYSGSWEWSDLFVHDEPL